MYKEYFIGDNLELLKKLLENKYKFQLIYLDPPYNTGRDFNDFNDKFEDIRVYAYEFLKPRFEIMKKLLTTDGVIVVHVEPKISHYVRLVMDDIYDKIVEKLRGNLTSDEYKEMITLEYVLTWGYDKPDDEERYKYLTNKKYNKE